MYGRRELSVSSSSSGGVGFVGALFLVLMVLKLTGYIDWSWWWITAPLWGGLALVIFILSIIIGLFWIGEWK